MEYPVCGYVVDQIAEGTCQLTWILEQADFTRGEEKKLLERMAARLAAEAQLAVRLPFRAPPRHRFLP